MTDRESVNVLQECIDLQLKKSQDYQNPNSNVVQAMHYRRGIDTIYDIMHGKMIRVQSLLESGSTPNHESIEDSFKDLINYASFAVSYLRGNMEGQDPERDMFNKPKPQGNTVFYTIKPSVTFKSPKNEYTVFGSSGEIGDPGFTREDKITVACLACGLDPDDIEVRRQEYMEFIPLVQELENPTCVSTKYVDEGNDIVSLYELTQCYLTVANPGLYC